MFLWFIGLSLALTALVFQSPALDYRAVMAGSVLPLLDGLTGGAWVLHTLAAPVLALVAVMAATRRRRLARRRWLGIPIGMFVHLVLDATWADTELFWWPLFGWSLSGTALPEAGRGAVGFLLELAGAGALAWAWNRYRFGSRPNRARFLRTGQLPRC
ncbi:MAG: hypothetical protein ACT4PW_11785 [Acidimicrobiia bacterium]